MRSWFLELLLKAPTSKLQAPEKLQERNFNSRPNVPDRKEAALLGPGTCRRRGLEVEVWSFSGAWGLAPAPPLFFQTVLRAATGTEIKNLISAPAPGALWISQRPPIFSSRCRMFFKPLPRPGRVVTAAGSK